MEEETKTTGEEKEVGKTKVGVFVSFGDFIISYFSIPSYLCVVGCPP